MAEDRIESTVSFPAQLTPGRMRSASESQSPPEGPCSPPASAGGHHVRFFDAALARDRASRRGTALAAGHARLGARSRAHPDRAEAGSRLIPQRARGHALPVRGQRSGQLRQSRDRRPRLQLRRGGRLAGPRGLDRRRRIGARPERPLACDRDRGHRRARHRHERRGALRPWRHRERLLLLVRRAGPVQLGPPQRLRAELDPERGDRPGGGARGQRAPARLRHVDLVRGGRLRLSRGHRPVAWRRRAADRHLQRLPGQPLRAVHAHAAGCAGRRRQPRRRDLPLHVRRFLR